MKKIIIGILILIFIVGCGSEQTEAPRQELRTGIQGAQIEFIDNINSIYEDSPLQTLFKITNKGAETINKGIYSVSVDGIYIQPKSEKIGEFNLLGKVDSPGGDIYQNNFNSWVSKLDTQLQRIDTNIAINICYPYKTLLSADVCVDTDIYNQQSQKVCKNEPIILQEGQGAPLEIIEIESRYVPNENKIIPEFLIKYQNMGGGRTINQKYVNDVCKGKRVNSKEWDNIEIKAWLLDDKLDCEKMRTEDTIYKTRCKLKEGIKNTGTYVSQLKVQLDYGYTQSINKNIEILTRK